jgi:hypothetical protein
MKSVLARTILHARMDVVLGMLCGMTGASLADNIYTFEAPQFTLGETTPLLNQAPNSGDPAFRTSFTVDETFLPSTFEITNLNNSGVIVGQALFQPFLPAIANHTLTLTFNIPVTQLSVDFAINDPNTSPPGELVLNTLDAAHNFVQPASNVGGPFQGGTLIFNAATPFTSATLSGFLNSSEGGAPITQIEIDNLHLTEVPGPIVGAGLPGVVTTCGGLLAWWRRRQENRLTTRRNSARRLRQPGSAEAGPNRLRFS